MHCADVLHQPCQKLGLSAANGAEMANPVAVDLLQGELNLEQMCGLWTSRGETR